MTPSPESGMTDKRRCSENVTSQGGWHRHQCSKNAKVEEGGKWWCKIHSPSYVKSRRAALEAKWDREAAERAKTYPSNVRRAAIEQCIAVVEDFEDVRHIARALRSLLESES